MKFNLKQYLLKKNFEPSDDTNYWSNGLYKIAIRKDLKLLFIGMMSTFNKWGDSTDFSFKIPLNEKEFDKILRIMEEVKQCGDSSHWINTISCRYKKIGKKYYCGKCFNKMVKKKVWRNVIKRPLYNR